MYMQNVCKIFLIIVLTELIQESFSLTADQGQSSKSSFTRYVEYAETPFHRPSYFSVPFRAPPNNNLQYVSNEMFSHLIREHTRHQQRVKLMHQNRYSDQQSPLSTKEPILQGVRHINELRQTPFRRYSHNSTALTYEEKRRRWKEDLKQRIRSGKLPARPIGSQTPVGTAGRYYITFNPFSNAYQVSRRLPSYIRTEDLGPEMTPDTLLSTIPQTTPKPTTTSTSTTTRAPIIIEQHATEIPNEIEQLVRIPSIPKEQKAKDSSPIRQILNLDYYDDEFEPPESDSESEQELENTQIPFTTTTTQIPLTTTTTTRRPYTTTQIPFTTTTTQRPYTTTQPTHPSTTTQYNPPIVYPPITTQRPIYQTTTNIVPTQQQQRSSLFSSYEDDDEGAEEDDEDFLFFKPGADSKKSTSRPSENDPFHIIVHNDDQ